ncbi:17513_t:CDS:2 [Dentiscutata erythropus]|uniref:17513_t:CDS:1 n=1 Tax=Dentiscutata erythropus TaxID=1348616 RepID=A0A9N9BYN8_9GLOM|nr:17513_t:CDS:2 [Dentiscutata erythropus]
MELQETTIDTTDILDYYLEELAEMEQYFCFDEKIAEYSTQVSSTNKGKEGKEAPAEQIYVDSEEYKDDNMLDETQNKAKESRSLQKLSKSTNINVMNEDQVTLEKPEEEDYTDSDNDCYTDNAMPDKEVTSIKVSQNIQNPARVIGRGRPSKRRYMSSIEKEQSYRRTSRGIYKCRQCGEVDHNSAYHK